jgi:transcriptional regulator with XRE-family HTH domain
MKLYGSLDNYIKMNRQRVGLSQDELGLLIAIDGRASVARYEQGLRLPQLETLLALEIVLGQPILDLFAGVAERVRANVMSRARTLLESLDDTPSKELVLKLELLSKLAHPDDHHVIPIWEEKA